MQINYLNIIPNKNEKNEILNLLNKINFNVAEVNIFIKNLNKISKDYYDAKIENNILHLNVNNYRSLIYFLNDNKEQLFKKNIQSLLIKLEYRGILLDTGRNRIPNFKFFKLFINECLNNHLNFFQIYFECAIEYQELIDSKIDKISWKMLRKIKNYCQKKGLIFTIAFPNLGHLYDLLIEKKYQSLSATSIKYNGYSLYDKQMHYSLDPLNYNAINISKNLVSQVIEEINPEYINLCGDETFDLLSTEYQNKINNKYPYEIYQTFLIDSIKSLNNNKEIMIWTDIFCNYKTLKINDYLINNIIGLNWNYHPQAYIDNFYFINQQNMKQINCFMSDSCNEGIMNFISSQLNMEQLYFYALKFSENTKGLLMTIWNDCGSNNSIVSSLPLLYEFNNLFLQKNEPLGLSFCQTILKENNVLILQLIQGATLNKCFSFKEILFWYEEKWNLTTEKIFKKTKFLNLPPQNCEISNTYLNWLKKSIKEKINKKNSELGNLYLQETLLMIDNFIINNTIGNYIQKYELNLEVPKLAMDIIELLDFYKNWEKRYFANWSNYYQKGNDINLIPNIYQNIIEYFKKLNKKK